MWEWLPAVLAWSGACAAAWLAWLAFLWQWAASASELRVAEMLRAWGEREADAGPPVPLPIDADPLLDDTGHVELPGHGHDIGGEGGV